MAVRAAMTGALAAADWVGGSSFYLWPPESIAVFWQGAAVLRGFFSRAGVRQFPALRNFVFSSDPAQGQGKNSLLHRRHPISAQSGGGRFELGKFMSDFLSWAVVMAKYFPCLGWSGVPDWLCVFPVERDSRPCFKKHSGYILGLRETLPPTPCVILMLLADRGY